jgi:hypothetical protein
MPLVDENNLPPSRYARDVPARPQPIKSNKQRGSILLERNPGLFNVFEDKDQGSGNKKGVEEQASKEGIRMGRIKNLEAAVKSLQKKNERTVIDQKTLSDRRKSMISPYSAQAHHIVSTTEANFVELKYELLLATKPSPSTPARSQKSQLHDTSFDSPHACPSLTGAEENTTFASPPVPALARKLLRKSMQGQPTSGLRSEICFDNLSDEFSMLDQDSMEIMQDEQQDGFEGHRSTNEKSFGFTDGGNGGSAKKIANPPPTFDPEQSLGDISVIEGISLDAAQAGAYLDNLSRPEDIQFDTGSLLQGTNEEGEAPEERLDNYASVSSQTELLMTTISQACVSGDDSTPDMVNATIQTDDDDKTYCDMAVQVQVPSGFAVGISLTIQVLQHSIQGRRRVRKTPMSFWHRELKSNKQTVGRSHT